MVIPFHGVAFNLGVGVVLNVVLLCLVVWCFVLFVWLVYLLAVLLYLLFVCGCSFSGLCIVSLLIFNVQHPH